MARITKTEHADKLAQLRDILNPGDTIYTTLDHVSRSGMYRVISLKVIRDNEPHDITYLAADLLEGYDRRHQGAKAHGCGMDMGFHLVYSLSRILWGEGWECIGQTRCPKCGRTGVNTTCPTCVVPTVAARCPSNDHSNGDRDYTPHQHRDGGYALVQRWL